MTYNVFGGTLNLTQSINQTSLQCLKHYSWATKQLSAARNDLLRLAQIFL